MKDYKDVVIPKPWGKEYLLFEENNVAGWILYINRGEKTSLHCHPKKKTSLIVLDGDAKISFLTSSTKVSRGDKTIIRQGVFHSTEALSDLCLLEIETPVDKEDLVRLKDLYGREGTPYETTEHPRGDLDYIETGKLTETEINGTRLCFKEDNDMSNFDLVVFLEPGLVSKVAVIAGEGDCLTRAGYNMLSSEFEAANNVKRLEINV
tara:strand:+ start:2882 stop:3502 length:621 start_codon:yes stop_codon:yes gene_type:complete